MAAAQQRPTTARASWPVATSRHNLLLAAAWPVSLACSAAVCAAAAACLACCCSHCIQCLLHEAQCQPDAACMIQGQQHSQALL
jgi:hypothetical protein